MSALEPARIAPGGFRELGPVNWAIAKLGARAIRAPRFTLMNVLGQHKLLFLENGATPNIVVSLDKDATASQNPKAFAPSAPAPTTI